MESKEDPLHRLSRTQTNACRQHQWAVWKEAEKERRTPIKSPPKSRSPVRSPTRHRTGLSPRKETSPHIKKAANPTTKNPTSIQTLNNSKTFSSSSSSVRAHVASPPDINTHSPVAVPSVIVTKLDSRISGLSFSSATNKNWVLELFDETKATDLFDRLDDNESGKLSLAELDKGIVTLFPEDFNHKPAIMRAYKATGASGDGFVSRNEFPFFLNYIVYYNNLWSIFESLDEDGDRRISREEWMEAAAKDEEMDSKVFDQVDANGGGMVLFDELCKYMTQAKVGGKLVVSEGGVAKLSVSDGIAASADGASY